MTDFFQQMSKFLKGFDIKISMIQAPNGEITVGVFPTHKNEEITEKLKPLMITGKPEEFDRDFFHTIAPAVETAIGLATNITGYNDELKKLEGEKKEKVEEKKTKSSRTSLPPTSMKPDAKKPASKKSVAKKAVVTEKAAPRKKNKITIKMELEQLIQLGKLDEATKFVEQRTAKGGLNKAKIDELYAMIEKAKAGGSVAVAEQPEQKQELGTVPQGADADASHPEKETAEANEEEDAQAQGSLT